MRRFANETVRIARAISCETTVVAQTSACRHWHRRGFSRPCSTAANPCSPVPLGHGWSAQQRSSAIAGWPDRWIHQCVLDVSSSAPANGIVLSHERSFVVIVRGNERAEPSWLFQRPQNALISLEVKLIADSCRRHKDWRQTSRCLCTALSSSPRSTGNQFRCHSCTKLCSRSVCWLPGSRGTHRLLLRTYTQLVVGYCTWTVDCREWWRWKTFVLSDVSLSHSLSRCVCVERGRMHLFRELGAWIRTNSASVAMCIVTTAFCTPWLLILKQ